MNFDRIIEDILRDCYWDYDFSSNEIKSIINSDDFRKKQKLFSKIIHNSTDSLNSLLIFGEKDLKLLFDSFSASYNKKYIIKKVMILRNILFGEKNRILTLEWKK